MKTSLIRFAAVVLAAGCSGSGPVVVESVSPAKGLASGGQKVRLSGSGFTEDVKVKIGGKPAKVVGVQSGALDVLSPRGVAGPATIEVSLADSASALDGGFTYEPITLSYVDVARVSLGGLPVDGADVQLGDGNADGRLDVFQAARTEGVVIYPNLGAGKFGAAQKLEPVIPPVVIDAGFIDAGTKSSDAGFVDAGFVLEPPLDVRSLVTGDFDGDGKLDLFLCTTGKVQSQLWRGAAGQFAFVKSDRQPEVYGVDQTALAADLDSDGDLDLLTFGAAASATGAAQVVMLANDGRGNFTDVTAGKLAGPAFDAPGAAMGDLDGDGKLDLFFSGGTDVSRVYLGDGHGVFQRAAPDALPNNAKPMAGVPAMGDLDGDGFLDIYMPTATQDRVLFNDGTAHFDDVSTIFLGVEAGSSTHAQLVDLDLDGALDVVVVDRPGRLRMYRNDGQGRLFDYSFELIGNDATLLNTGLAIGDLDGDGDDDVFVSRGDFARPELFFNLSPVKPADSDGDLVPDGFDNCPAVANRDQAEKAGLAFGCASGAACKVATSCELKMQGESAYLFCKAAPAAWAEAKTKCTSFGGHLVAIGSAEENAWLRTGGYHVSWIGLNDLMTEGTFVWASDEPVGFKAWSGLNPDNSMGLEDCVTFLGETGKWNDDQCQLAKPFICEADRAPNPTTGDACTMKPDGGT